MSSSLSLNRTRNGLPPTGPYFILALRRQAVAGWLASTLGLLYASVSLYHCCQTS